MLKLALSVLLMLLAICARAGGPSDVLVLIPPERAGPNVDLNIWIHPEWVLWPPAVGLGENRLLSITSGIDWEGSGYDLSFRKAGSEHTWIPNAGRDMERRGHFSAVREILRDRKLVPLEGPSGVASPSALLISATTSGPIDAIPLNGPLPSGAVLVYVTQDWNELPQIAQKAGGRMIVVEYPPPPGQSWSRMWRWDKHWPQGIPTSPSLRVAGLLQAKDLMKVLLRPESALWVPNDTGDWGGANRWFEYTQWANRIVYLVAGFLFAYVLLCAAYCVSREEKGRFATLLIRCAMLFPLAVAVDGPLTRWLGLGAWAAALSLSAIFSALAYVLSLFIWRRFDPDVHPLLPLVVIGAVTTAFCEPTWSLTSRVFGFELLPISPEGSAIFLTYVVGACAFVRSGSIAFAWSIRILAVALTLWGLLPGTWWSNGWTPFALVPLVALVAGEGWFRPPFLLLLACLPTSVLEVVKSGVVFAPGGLIEERRDEFAMNLVRHAEFIASPFLWGYLLLTAGVLLVGGKFFMRQMRVTARRELPVRAVAWSAAGVLALGLLQPYLLYTGLVLVIGGTLFLLHDALLPV